MTRLTDIRIRAGLFAVSFLAMLWGYRLLLAEHAPDIFRNTMEDMSYGWYIPVFSLYVLWRERKEIIETISDPSWWGIVFLLPFAFMGFLGARGAQIRLEIVGFVGMLLGLAWAFFGVRTMRRVLFPVGFLLFCLPLHSYLDLVTIHLRLFAVSGAYAILQGLGIDIVREGTMLMSPSGAFSIDVAEPCSGMRSLFAMMALTAGYAYFTQPTWFRRGLLFALSVPIAIVGNVSRILSIVLVSICSPTFGTGFYHDYSGYIVFLVSILLMVAAGGALTKGAEQCRKS